MISEFHKLASQDCKIAEKVIQKTRVREKKRACRDSNSRSLAPQASVISSLDYRPRKGFPLNYAIFEIRYQSVMFFYDVRFF